MSIFSPMAPTDGTSFCNSLVNPKSLLFRSPRLLAECRKVHSSINSFTKASQVMCLDFHFSPSWAVIHFLFITSVLVYPRVQYQLSFFSISLTSNHVHSYELDNTRLIMQMSLSNDLQLSTSIKIKLSPTAPFQCLIIQH